jgi:hypothetical protein
MQANLCLEDSKIHYALMHGDSFAGMLFQEISSDLGMSIESASERKEREHALHAQGLQVLSFHLVCIKYEMDYLLPLCY